MCVCICKCICICTCIYIYICRCKVNAKICTNSQCSHLAMVKSGGPRDPGRRVAATPAWHHRCLAAATVADLARVVGTAGGHREASNMYLVYVWIWIHVDMIDNDMHNDMYIYIYNIYIDTHMYTHVYIYVSLCVCTWICRVVGRLSGPEVAK